MSVHLVWYRDVDGSKNVEKVFFSKKSAERYVASLSEPSRFYWPRSIEEREVE